MHHQRSSLFRSSLGASFVLLASLVAACGGSEGETSGAAGMVSSSGPGGALASGGSSAVAGGANQTTGGNAAGATAVGGASTTAGSVGNSGGFGAGGTLGTAGATPGGSASGGSANGGLGNVGGGSANAACGATNPAVVPLPMIGSATFDVTTYGAVGDDKTDNTKTLQAALTAAASAGGGTVVVPKGTFLSGPIVLGNATALSLSAGAVLKMLPKASYPSITPLITAAKAHDIALIGSGTIDGQGQDWWDAFAADATTERPQEVSFSNSARVLIRGVRFQNSPEEHIWVKGDTDLTITDITISTLAVAGKSPPKNTDGVDMTANGVFFCNNQIACGDDNVALNGSNIYLAYSQFGVGHGCSIGSITKNGVSKLTVDHITFDGTTSGVRLKSARDRGGLVQNVSYTNLTMTNVQNPVMITSYYPTLPTDPTADAAQAVTTTTPYWKDITIKNVTATGSANGGVVWGLPEAKVSNLIFDNVQIAAKTGMQIFHADGVSFINGSSVKPQSGAAITIDDAAVTGATTTAF